VFHYHGIHHSNKKERYEQTVRIMENLHMDFSGDLPASFKPGQLNIIAFVPLIGEIKCVDRTNLLLRTIQQLRQCSYIKDVIVISERDSVLLFAQKEGVKAIKREEKFLARGKSVENTLNFALTEYEKQNPITDAVLFVNYLFPFRPDGFFNALIEQYVYTGSDSTIAAFKNFRLFWFCGERGYQMIGENLKPRSEKNPVYEGLIGLGCITSSRFIRKGMLLGDQVELLNIANQQYTIKVSDPYFQEIARFFLEKELSLSEKKQFLP